MRPISAVQGDPTSQINQMMAKQIAREEARERAVAEKKAREAAALEVRLRLYPTHQRWSNFFTSHSYVFKEIKLKEMELELLVIIKA